MTALTLFLACTAAMAAGTVIGGAINRWLTRRAARQWDGRIR
jgi:hypothetical protein